MVTDGLRPIRDQVLSCGMSWPRAEGKVRVEIQVAPDGHVVHAEVKQSPQEGLGNCVADAMAKASFAATQAGGSFVYPWEFASPPGLPPALPPPPARTARCAQQVAYLQDFVHHLDVRDPQIASPWLDEDARRDHHVDELVEAFQAAIKPERKADHFAPLNMRNVMPGELERLYAKCPASLASLKKIESADGDALWGYWHQAVDGLTNCSCHADLTALRVFYYLLYRGPF